MGCGWGRTSPALGPVYGSARRPGHLVIQPRLLAADLRVGLAISAAPDGNAGRTGGSTEGVGQDAAMLAGRRIKRDEVTFLCTDGHIDFAARTYRETARKPVEKVVHHDRWGNRRPGSD